MCLAKAMRHASKYSIGAMPTARWKRSKNVERDSADSFASCATVHAYATRTDVAIKRDLTEKALARLREGKINGRSFRVKPLG